MKAQRCITLTPHIPVDETNERHAYATVLLYGDWKHGEKKLLRHCSSAVERLQQIWPTLPSYVTLSLNEKKVQEQLFTSIPTPNETPGDHTSTEEEEMLDFDTNFRQQPAEYNGVIEEVFDLKDNSFIIRNTSPSKLAYLHKFIDNRKEEWKNSYSKKYAMTENEFKLYLADPSLFIPIDDDDYKNEELNVITLKMNSQQQRAFNIVTEHVSDQNSNQMVMLMTGPGGSGKPQLITIIKLIIINIDLIKVKAWSFKPVYYLHDYYVVKHLAVVVQYV